MNGAITAAAQWKLAATLVYVSRCLGLQRQERLCKEEIKFVFFDLSEVERCPSPQERSRASSFSGRASSSFSHHTIIFELGTFYRHTSASQGIAVVSTRRETEFQFPRRAWTTANIVQVVFITGAIDIEWAPA
jgi:hypothetical protein